MLQCLVGTTFGCSFFRNVSAEYFICIGVDHLVDDVFEEDGHKALTAKNYTTLANVIWNITLCDCIKNRRFEENIASIYKVIGLRVFLAPSEDMPHDGRGRASLATAPPQLCPSVTAKSLL
jgi:hypothetical protein